MMNKLIKVFSMILNCLESFPNLILEIIQSTNKRREIPIGRIVENKSLDKNPPETAQSILATVNKSNSMKESKSKNPIKGSGYWIR